MWVTLWGDPVTEITHFERMGLNGLSSNFLILTRRQAFIGKEGISLLVHDCYHTLAYYLFCFSNSLFLLSSLLFFFFTTPFFRCFLVVLLCYPIFFLLFVFSPVHDGGPFNYIACRDEFLLFYPLSAFVWVQMSFQITHWLDSYPATTTYLCWPCHISLLDKESYFVCLLTPAFPSE